MSLRKIARNCSFCSKINLSVSSVFLLILIALAIQACGGGTGGTGIKAYEGNVRTLDQKPLSNARLTIEDTGDSSITDQEGNFILYSRAFGAHVRFLIETPQFSQSFTLTDISADSSRINVGLVVDSAAQSVQITQFSVKAKMVGKCAQYFQNGESIDQVIEIPSPGDVLCTLDMRVFGDGLLRRKVPIVLQHSGCDPDDEWITDAQTETGDKDRRGIAKLEFRFEATQQKCRYRILAPFNYRGFTPIAYPINTLFTKN